MEAGGTVLRRGGQILTVYGAVREGARTVDFERQHNRGEINAFLMFYATVVVGVGAGVLDDGLAAAATTMSGSPAPVMDSWDQNGSGPVQHAAGEAIRGFLGWGFDHGL